MSLNRSMNCLVEGYPQAKQSQHINNVSVKLVQFNVCYVINKTIFSAETKIVQKVKIITV